MTQIQAANLQEIKFTRDTKVDYGDGNVKINTIFRQYDKDMSGDFNDEEWAIYEQALKEKDITSISPLFPITIELSASDLLTIKERLEDLLSIGFDIKEFGVNTFVVKSHPTWLKEGYEEESVRKIFDIVISSGKKFDPVKFNEHIAITLACKMSIKANMRISTEAQEEILNELTNTDNPYNCPHRRPTIIKFTTYDLEKMFKRVMN